MLYKLSTLLLLTTAATALPLNRRQGPRIDEAATREAHRKDESATRAATAIAIKARQAAPCENMSHTNIRADLVRPVPFDR